MREIKKVGVVAAAKIFGIIGLINGIILAIILQFTESQTASLAISDLLLLIVLQGLTWFVGALVVAFVYNLLAKWIGGIKLEL